MGAVAAAVYPRSAPDQRRNLVAVYRGRRTHLSPRGDHQFVDMERTVHVSDQRYDFSGAYRRRDAMDGQALLSRRTIDWFEPDVGRPPPDERRGGRDSPAPACGGHPWLERE